MNNNINIAFIRLFVYIMYYEGGKNGLYFS